MVHCFVRKLYEILENENEEIIRWVPDGSAFKIIDQIRFQQEIIPKYFRRKHPSKHYIFSSHDIIDEYPLQFPDDRLASVQRQLNLYGFKTIVKGDEKGTIFNPLFRRDNPDLIKHIYRVSKPKSSKSSTNSKETNLAEGPSDPEESDRSFIMNENERLHLHACDTNHNHTTIIAPFTLSSSHSTSSEDHGPCYPYDHHGRYDSFVQADIAQLNNSYVTEAYGLPQFHYVHLGMTISDLDLWNEMGALEDISSNTPQTQYTTPNTREIGVNTDVSLSWNH